MKNDNIEKLKKLKESIEDYMRYQLKELTLRTVTNDDVEEVARTWEDEEISLEDALNAISWMNSNHEKNETGKIHHLCFAVFLKNKIIGWCGFDGRFGDEIKIFYLIDKNHRKKGYATQCAQKLLEHAFKVQKINKIIGECAKDNIASLKVLEKVGMKKCVKSKDPDTLCYFIESNENGD